MLTIQQALAIADRPLQDTLAFYHTLVFKGLLGSVPKFDTEGKESVAESLVISPTSPISMLPFELAELLTTFVLQDKKTPYEGVILSPVFVAFHGDILYGYPETKLLGKPESPVGHFINMLLLERFRGKAMGFRGLWNSFPKVVNVRRPNVFMSTFSTDLSELETEIKIAEPDVVLVVTDEDFGSLPENYYCISPSTFDSISSVTKNKISTAVQLALVKPTNKYSFNIS